MRACAILGLLVLGCGDEAHGRDEARARDEAPRAANRADDHAATPAAVPPPTSPPPAGDPMIARLCQEQIGGEGAKVTPWRDAQGVAKVYQLDGSFIHLSDPPTWFYDPAGTRVYGIGFEPIDPASAKAHKIQAERDALLHGLTAGPAEYCKKP